MNETLICPTPSFQANCFADKSDFLRVNNAVELSNLADRVFGNYILQNTLSSAGSAFYKNDYGVGLYSQNTYLKLELPKFPTCIKLGVYISTYNHGSMELKLIGKSDDKIITLPFLITFNNRNNDWSWMGSNQSGIYLNGRYDTKYCGWRKVETLINKIGQFDVEWKVQDFPDCYEDSTPCYLHIIHTSAYSSKALFINYFELFL